MASGYGVKKDGATAAYAGSRFSEVRAQLLSDPYTVLPKYKVSIGSMFKAGKDLLWRDSTSLVHEDADLVPPMQKLVNALGICMFGRWRITEDTGYTGCLRGGTDYLIIVRCSTTLSETERGAYRGFSLAGKIFPTLNPDDMVKTVNLVCIDSLGGTKAPRFADVGLTNEPELGANPGLLKYLLVAINGVRVFRSVGAPNALHRPVYGLYEYGLAPGETPKGPKWIQVKVEEGIGKSDASDFRDELRVANYKDGRLRFSVAAASEKSATGERLWRRIGTIELNEDVCSASGDHRIRFRHLPNRSNAPE